MRWLRVINVTGVLAGAGYTGFAFTPSHTPLWAGIATLLLLVALFVPLAAEYGSLDKGFNEIGGSYFETRRREQGIGPAQEVFIDAPPPPVFRQSRRVQVIGIAITLVAVGLFTLDIRERHDSQPPESDKPDVIRHF
ncbi:MAG: hypothetical protein VW338_06290 [Rhodospirillaceae bacterium]